jgi:hypothetical protein
MPRDFWSEIFEYYIRFQTVFFRPIRRASMAGQSNRSWRTTGNSAHIMPPSATTLRTERERPENPQGLRNGRSRDTPEDHSPMDVASEGQTADA